MSGVTVKPEEAVLMEMERRNMTRQTAVYSTERGPVLCGNLFPHHNVFPLTDGNRDESKPEFSVTNPVDLFDLPLAKR